MGIVSVPVKPEVATDKIDIGGARSAAKRLLPRRARDLLGRLSYARARAARVAGIRDAFRYDEQRYAQYSSTISSRISRQNHAARMTATYHNLEKGLALPAPRPGFGAGVVRRLLDLIDEYLERYGVDEISTSATAALVAYREFNLAAGLSPAEIPEAERLQRLDAPERVGGTKILRKQDVLAAVDGVDGDFFASRSSVRCFADRTIDDGDVEFAVRAAQKSPAVCNRQYSRAYVATDLARVARALELQAGARGFSDQVPAVAVITTSMRTFSGAGERMQAWTDGGMFAMSFVLGLHARGLGAVCLNWSKTEADDRAFHAAFELPEDEVIIMLVGFGHLQDETRVAVSPRMPVDRALRPL